MCRYFGGGTITAASARTNWAMFREGISERFEDGTANFQAIVSIRHAFQHFYGLYKGGYINRQILEYKRWNFLANRINLAQHNTKIKDMYTRKHKRHSVRKQKLIKSPTSVPEMKTKKASLVEKLSFYWWPIRFVMWLLFLSVRIVSYYIIKFIAVVEKTMLLILSFCATFRSLVKQTEDDGREYSGVIYNSRINRTEDTSAESSQVLLKCICIV